MRLPNADRAVINDRKLRDYVLSRSHPIGRFKAAFLESIGFAPEDWRRLRAALRDMAETTASEAAEATPYGQKYITRGELVGPSGRSASVIVVWIVRTGENVPRFVTVYPG